MAVAMIGPKFYAWDRNGKPLAFGKLYTYQARTNTPKATYQSEDQQIENTNPVILNGEGYANIYLDGSYKMVLKDKDENEIWSSDPVTENQADEWVNCFSAEYVSPTSFKIAGNQIDNYTTGRKLRIDNATTEYAYASVSSSVYAAGETSVVVNAPVVLTSINSVCTSVVSVNSSFNKNDLGGLSSYESESFNDMLNGITLDKNPITLAIGQRWSSGGSKWSISGSEPITTDNFRAFNAVCVLDFGAVGDGSSDDTEALQSAISTAITKAISTIYLPSGNYIITDTLTVDTGVFAQGIGLVGDGNTSKITQTGVDKDAIVFSETQFLTNSFIKDLEIVSGATSGHTINVKYGLTGAEFKNLNLVALNPNKSIFYGDWTGQGVDYGGIFDTIWEGGTYTLSNNHQTYGMRFLCNGTVFNENSIRNVRMYNSYGTSFANAKPWIFITQAAPTVWLNNNNFENINFEICSGGLIYIESPRGCRFVGIADWDSPTKWGSGISFGSGAGYDGANNIISQYIRHGGALGDANTYDIDLGTAFGTVVENPSSNNNDLKVHFRDKVAIYLGYAQGVRDGFAATTIVNEIDGVISSNITARSTIDLTGVLDIKDSGGYAKVSDKRTSGLILSTLAGGGGEKNLFWTGNGFWPVNDGVPSCGVAGGSWSEVFAINGTINTSDARLKKAEPIPDAVLDAWSEVEKVQFKWLSAIEEKGEDSARWHIGVLAQDVISAFENHGLDATKYSVLCWDEWPEQVIVTDDIETTIQAGERYAIRYSEAAQLDIALERRERKKLQEKIDALLNK